MLFDLTKQFFREQLFKGLRQNILMNNIWGSYNVLQCMDMCIESNDNDLQRYFNTKRFIYELGIRIKKMFVYSSH